MKTMARGHTKETKRVIRTKNHVHAETSDDYGEPRVDRALEVLCRKMFTLAGTAATRLDCAETERVAQYAEK